MIKKRTTLTASERKQRLFLLLFSVILCGAAVGTVLTMLPQNGMDMKWMPLIGVFFETEPTLPALCTEAVGNAILFFIGLFLFGFSAIGQPGAMLLLFGYGACMGSAMCVQCAGTNMILRLLCLMPYFVPVSVLLTLATRESLRFSALFTAYGFRDEPADNMYHHIRLYFARFVVLLIFLLLLAVLYSLGFYALLQAKRK